MLFIDLLQETYSALLSNKSRSALTVLGIVIGIASVVTMVSIGRGTAKSIEDNIQSLGSNLLVVMPGSQRSTVGGAVRGGMGSATTLTVDDAEAIAENVPSAVEVSATVSSRKQVKTTKGANTNTSVYGADEAYARIKNIEMSSGSFLTDIQSQKISKVAVIGPTVRDDLFGEDSDPVGEKIRIDNLEFTVIGVTAAKGGSGFGSSDDLIYVPLNTALRYFTGGNSVSNINVQVSEADLMDIAQEQITALLLGRHNIADATQADFSIMNQADILDSATSISDTLTILLGAIAGISLLVGGIGIMNMMLTTVTERTREIGLRKSLGAEQSDISNQFLAESIALTFTGGVIGIILGCAASWIVNRFSSLTTDITFLSVLMAFGVSAFIGIVFGYYPAHRAAKLNPIEALRYE